MRKLSSYESNMLVESLSESLSKEVDGYVGNIEEVKNMMYSESEAYPASFKSAYVDYIGLLDALTKELTSIQDKADKMLSTFPTTSVVSFSGVTVNLNKFTKFLSHGFTKTPKKQGNLYQWTSSSIYLFSEMDPASNDGEMGVVYFIGDRGSLKEVTKRFEAVGEMGDAESDVPIPF
jgi:hypothetical protein